MLYQLSSRTDFNMGFFSLQVAATRAVCGDFSNPLLVVLVRPETSTAFTKACEPVKSEGPLVNEELVGDRYQEYEDSVLQKLQKV